MCVDQIVSFRLPKINKIFKNTNIFGKIYSILVCYPSCLLQKKARSLKSSNSALWYFAKTNVINDGMFPALWDRVCV